MLIHLPYDWAKALDLARATSARMPETRIVMLGVPDGDHNCVQCVEAGASGWVSRMDSFSRLKEVLRVVRQGELACSPRLAYILKVKTFLGTSANAVRTQIWTALIAMLILRYLQMKSPFGWSLSNLAALLRQQLFIFRDLWGWLNAPMEGPPAARALREQLPMALVW